MTNVTITANTTTSPSNTFTADTVTGIGVLGPRLIQSNSISFTTGTSYSLSVFAKKGTNDFIQLFVPLIIGGMSANFNINTGVVGTLATVSGTAPTSSIINYGDGWYRCTMNFTATTTTSTVTSIGIVTSASAARSESNTLTTSIILWGAQVEVGAYATSYIPTTTATVPRAADVISKTGVSSLIGQTEGTLYFESKGFSDGNTAFQFITLNDNTITNNNQIGFNYNTSGVINGYFRVNSNTLTISSTVSKTLNSKIILKYNSSNVYTLFINGSLIGSATAASSFSSPLTTFKTSQGDGGSPYNGNIKSIVLYKTALSDDQCILLTGPSFSSYPEMANALIYTIQ
jgi:hypothetical protein